MAERADFTTMLAQSSLQGADAVAGLRAGDWNQALRALALALPDDRPRSRSCSSWSAVICRSWRHCSRTGARSSAGQ
ncbi:MAG TPA: hypothetical protein VN969_00805 [Streptosporangiaceae bacterium]|nr:hypothetical protein [Streptosporangiaceae bacterium]